MVPSDNRENFYLIKSRAELARDGEEHGGDSHPHLGDSPFCALETPAQDHATWR